MEIKVHHIEAALLAIATLCSAYCTCCNLSLWRQEQRAHQERGAEELLLPQVQARAAVHITISMPPAAALPSAVNMSADLAALSGLSAMAYCSMLMLG